MQARLEVPTGTAGYTQRRAYGYLRLPDSPDDSAAAVLEETMHDFAELHGLHFIKAFHDFPMGTCDGLQTLIDEMQAASATVLLVPSLMHLAASPLLQNMYIERLEAGAGAAVVAMDGAEL
jgi:hypothetical protein